MHVYIMLRYDMIYFRMFSRPYVMYSYTVCAREAAALAWMRYLERSKSFLVDLMQGQLRSKLCCQRCGHESRKFEPFMYLSLPASRCEKASCHRSFHPKRWTNVVFDGFLMCFKPFGSGGRRCTACISLRSRMRCRPWARRWGNIPRKSCFWAMRSLPRWFSCWIHVDSADFDTRAGQTVLQHSDNPWLFHRIVIDFPLLYMFITGRYICWMW